MNLHLNLIHRGEPVATRAELVGQVYQGNIYDTGKGSWGNTFVLEFVHGGATFHLDLDSYYSESEINGRAQVLERVKKKLSENPAVIENWLALQKKRIQEILNTRRTNWGWPCNLNLIAALGFNPDEVKQALLESVENREKDETTKREKEEAARIEKEAAKERDLQNKVVQGEPVTGAELYSLLKSLGIKVAIKTAGYLNRSIVLVWQDKARIRKKGVKVDTACNLYFQAQKALTVNKEPENVSAT